MGAAVVSVRVPSVGLSERQIAEVVRMLAGARPSRSLVHDLEEQTRGDPAALIDLLHRASAEPRALLAGLGAALDERGSDDAVEQATFRREGDYWTIRYHGSVARLRHASGLAFLAQLLARPGHRLHAVELVGGRRGSPDQAERARVATTKAIGTALIRIDRALPDLGRHLRATVRRGFFCSYTPDPRNIPTWI